MIKVMLVDDEYWTRTSLRETIEWSKYGFEIVGEAEDADKGFEMYLKLLPDIIITDIRMGDTSGLDLVEKIHKHNRETEFIVLSGYEQFDYAKTAYENGIQSYLLKPVDNDELLSKMLIIREKIEKRSRQSNESFAITEQMKHLRNNYIYALFTSQLWNLPDLVEKCGLYGINLPKSRYIAASVCVDKHSGIQNDEMLKISSLLENSIEYFIKQQGDEACFCKQKQYIFSFVLPVTEALDDKLKIKDIMYDLQAQLEFVTEHTISIGFSGIHSGVEDIHTAYDEAREALCCMAWFGQSSIISFEEVPQNADFSFVISNEEIDGVTEAIYSGDGAAAKKIIEAFFAKTEAVSDLNILRIQNVMSEMIVIVVRSVLKNEQAIKEVFGKSLQPFAELQRFVKVLDIKSWVYAVIDKLINYCKSDEEKHTHHPLVEQAISIIEAEYKDQLSIDFIAERLYLSRRYLQYLFKKETGQTIHTYLTDFRINKAIELIKTGEYKMWEIGEMVGYQDSNYFGQVFKKVVGKTPQKYQEAIKSGAI